MAKTLNKKALEAAGITFCERVGDPESIFEEGSQSKQLALYLLDFTNLIALETWKELQLDEDECIEDEDFELVIRKAQPNPERSAALKAFRSRYDIPRCDRYYQSALQIKEEACNVASRDEERWTEVIKLSVFGDLREKARKLENKAHYTAADALERFRVESEHTWYLGATVLDSYCQKSHSDSNGLTAPKPDMFFAFHSYDEHARAGGPLSTDENISNFTVNTLVKTYEGYEKLVKSTKERWTDEKRPFGFCPSPLKGFISEKSVSLKESYCFPWSVCEWKHQGKIGKQAERSKLFCQAAHGAAVCLTLFANAASGGQPGDFVSAIRPVVYFTFTGHLARVWIGYVTSVEQGGYYKYLMRCVWEGSLLSTIDNIKLCAIIDRLHFWAMNYLRPWLSGCIGQWRRSVQLAGDEDESELDEEPTSTDELEDDVDHTITFKRALRRAATIDDCVDDDEEDDTGEGSTEHDADEDDIDGENYDEDFWDEDYIPSKGFR